MNSLILILSLALLGGVMPPSSNYESTQQSASEYVTIDETKLKFAKVIDNAPALDDIANECALDLWDKYPLYNVIQFNDAYKKRTIVGFDVSELLSVSRLTLKIQFNIYHSADVFHWFPKLVDYTFVLKSSDLLTPRYFTYLKDYVEGADTGADALENFSIPYIGSVASLYAFEEAWDAAVVKDATRKPYGYPDILYNQADKLLVSVLDSSIAESDFYVVMPVRHDISQVWISVAGIDSDNQPISDGLDDDGNAYVDPITGEKYIDFGTDTARSVYFTDQTIINQVRIAQSSVDSTRNLTFGDYDFLNNQFLSTVKSIDMLGDGQHYTGEPFIIVSGFDAVLTQGQGDYSMIRIYYESDGVAVYQNVLNSEGYENPISFTPETEEPNWWDTFIDAFWPDFTGGLNSFLSILQAILQTALIVFGLGLFVWVIVLIVRGSSKPAKSSTSKYKRKGGKK